MPKALCDTSHMTEKQWLAARQHGPDGSIPYTIGGSDTAVVLGISPWRSPWELYQIKRGAMSEPPKSNSLQLLMGHWLEPVAASCYAEITGNQVINDTILYQHNDRPYALANLDRRIIIDADKDTEHPLPKGSKGILECKSCSYTVREHWADGAWPNYYDCQVRYYMGIMELNFTDFATLWGNNPSNDFVHPRLFRSEGKEEALFEATDEFIWRLEKGKPPKPEEGCNAPADCLAKLAKLYRKNGGNSISTLELPRSLVGAAKKIEELTLQNAELLRQKKKNDEVIDLNMIRLAAVMKEYEHAVLDDGANRYLIDYVTASRTTIDTKLLKKDLPGVYDKYKKVSETSKYKVKCVSAAAGL